MNADHEQDNSGETLHPMSGCSEPLDQLPEADKTRGGQGQYQHREGRPERENAREQNATG